MFALVDDVERYPDFLPWCRSAREWSRNEDEVKASLEMQRGPLHKTFTTQNRLQPGKRLIDGPFRHLEGFWRFSALTSILRVWRSIWSMSFRASCCSS